jgi:hypothetical protein
MRTRSIWYSLAVLAMAAAGASAETAPLMRHTFEEGVGGWTTLGQSGKVAVTHEPAHVKEGKAALQFDYRIGPDEQSVLLLPTPDGGLAKLKSLRFWVQADHATPLIAMLQEQDGGRYVALFSVPKDQWQQVELSPSDFMLSEGPNDPKDPDNRLDLDRVSAFGIGDMGQFFAQAKEPGLAELLGVKTGPHTLYLDDFAASEEALPEAAASTSGEVNLDTFARPQASWLGIGGVHLSVGPGGGADRGRALRVEYRQVSGKIDAFARRVRRGALAGAERLMLDVASAKPARLVVQLEEADGGKYNTTVEVPGESAVQKLSLKLADFTAAEDSKDTNDRLDLDQINQVVILDATGLADTVDQDNTLRISRLSASRAK